MADERTIKVGLLGFGTVGRAVWDIVGRGRARFQRERGVDLVIDRVLVRDAEKARRWCADQGLIPPRLTTNPADVVENGIDVVVEAMGGLEPAGGWIERALTCAKPVVTANKKLVATRHAALAGIARRTGVRFGFEASVAGGVPIVRALSEGLCGDRVTEVGGIVNGTTNYILTRMAESCDSYEAALRAAQAAGFAEADPTNDVEGVDAAEKIAILAGLAFGVTVPVAQIPTRGIAQVTRGDIAAAGRLGRVIRLVASARLNEDGRPDLRVGPVLLPADHPLAHVRGERNAVIVRGEFCGELTFEGNGAGGGPTASAVVADLVDVARRPRGEARGAWRTESPAESTEAVAHYVRFRSPPGRRLVDRCADALARAGLAATSFAVVRDSEADPRVTVTLTTRRCTSGRLRRALGRAVDLSSGLVAPMPESVNGKGVGRS